MPQISFQADTQEELIEMVRRWVTGLTVEAAPIAEPSSDRRVHDVQEVMRRIRGEDSRTLVIEVAGAAARGAAVPRDEMLLKMFKKTTYTAFGGMVGGANKLMRRIGGRDLITWDAAGGGYRIDPRDAEVILAMTAEGSASSGQARRRPSGPPGPNHTKVPHPPGAAATEPAVRLDTDA